MHFCVPVFTCSQFESLYFYCLFLLGTVCPKPNINFHISIHINENKSKIKSYMETSVGNEGGFFLSILLFKKYHSAVIRSQNPEKRESLNRREKSFAESLNKLNSIDQIFKRNQYFYNKM